MKNFKKCMDKKTAFINTLFFVIAFLADQLSKFFIKSKFELGESLNIIGDFFKITFIYNRGMVWGLPIFNKYIFNTITILVTLFLFYYLYKIDKNNLLERLSFGLILGGGLGNLFDRLVYGKVVDFLDFGLSFYRWPVFNIADSCVTIGIILLIIFELFYNKKKHEQIENVNE